MEHSPGNLQKGGIICYHLMMDVENQLLQEMNGLGQVYVIFRELFLRVIDINYEGAEPPSSLYQLRVEQFSKCFVSWSNQNQAFNFPMTSLF